MADTIDFDAVRENLRREADAAPHYKPARPSGIFSAKELQDQVFAPIKYVVPGYLPEGLSILAGKPKIGKSWLVLDWAIGVAAGTNVMEDQPVEGGNVLYAALEDNQRRLQRRMETLLPDQSRFWPERLELTCAMPRLDDGGVQYVEDWLENADNPRLVIIDTLAKVRGTRSSKETEYEGDYKVMQALHALAAEKGVAIVMIHHTRKMGADDPIDSVSGTLGLTGCADTTLVLDRNVNGTVTLYGRGRDVEEIETALQFDKMRCKWKVLGDADQVSRSEQRNSIIQALGEEPEPVSPTELAAVVDMSAGNIKKLLHFMAKDGQVEKVRRGRYHLPGFNATPEEKVTEPPTDPGNPGNPGNQSRKSQGKQEDKPAEKVTGEVTDGNLEDAEDKAKVTKVTEGGESGNFREPDNSLKDKPNQDSVTKVTEVTAESDSNLSEEGLSPDEVSGGQTDEE